MESVYKTIYDRYFSNHEPYDAFVFHALEQLGGITTAGRRILEIGSGRGSFALFLALIGGAGKVVALDEAQGCGADKMLFRQIENILREYSIHNLEPLQADIANVGFPDKSFDLIVANFSLHHAIRSSGFIFKDVTAREEGLHIFNKIHACLADNGMLVLREMSRMNFWRFLPYKWKMAHIDWNTHSTLPEWIWLVEKSGFKNIRIDFLTPYFLAAYPSRLVRNKLSNFFFSSTFYLYAEK
jgi:SAM-dependent methyltransferase